MGDIVKVKDLPDTIKLALKRLGYRKHKAILTLCSAVEIYGTQWSGGSRNEWFSLHSDGAIVPCYFGNGPDDGHKAWPNNMGSMGVFEFKKETPCMICVGTFCGKAATAKIYIHPRFAQSIGIAPIGYTFTAEELEDWTK